DGFRCLIHLIDQPVAFVRYQLAGVGNLPAAAELRELAKLASSINEQLVHPRCGTGIVSGDVFQNLQAILIGFRCPYYLHKPPSSARRSSSARRADESASTSA